MSGNTGDPDMALIGELFEEIGRRPPAIAARKLLVEHYISVGWLDAAKENAEELKKIVPYDVDVAGFVALLQRKPELPPMETKKPASTVSKSSAEVRIWDPKTARYKKEEEMTKPKRQEIPAIQLAKNLDVPRQELTAGYQALRTKSRFVLPDLLNLQKLQKRVGITPSKHTARIQTLAEGRMSNNSSTAEAPGSARSVARTIKENPKEATNLAIADLECARKWIREPNGKPSGANNDALRDGLVQRRNAIESALPDNLKLHVDLALMHIEHEHLERNYANTETMLGDEVKDIPRTNFLATEDNYAWDIEELVQAITVGKGIMRNPLSKELFTPKDVKCILMHPSGKHLAALAVEQHTMSKGVRAQTIDEMEKLSKVLLEDQSNDTIPSRKAVDAFLAYVATCKYNSRLAHFLTSANINTATVPDLEQKAIEHLKCPAKDSHTGQAYDFSIGESVRDAKGNRVCFHKTGDFIKQAAVYLRQQRGVAPDADKCSTM